MVVGESDYFQDYYHENFLSEKFKHIHFQNILTRSFPNIHYFYDIGHSIKNSKAHATFVIISDCNDGVLLLIWKHPAHFEWIR